MNLETHFDASQIFILKKMQSYREVKRPVQETFVQPLDISLINFYFVPFALLLYLSPVLKPFEKKAKKYIFFQNQLNVKNILFLNNLTEILSHFIHLPLNNSVSVQENYSILYTHIYL